MDRIKIYLIILIIPILLFSGCWDKVEIDERAFITAIGYDKYEGGNEAKEENVEKETEKEPLNRYIRTITYPNVSLIAGKGQGKPFFVYSTVCASWADGRQQIALRDNKNFYVYHLKAVIFNEEIARDEELFREMFDTFERSVFLNRKLYFFVTPNKAQDILMTDTGKNMDVGLYIDELMSKENKPTRMAKSDLGTIAVDLRESNAALAPRIIKSKDEIKVSGAGVLKDNKLVGMLGELETRDVFILKGKVKLADYTIKVDDKFIVVSQTDLKTNMKTYEDKDGNINVYFDIRAEGDIVQHYFRTSKEPFDEKYIDRVNKKVNELISKELGDVFKKIQKDFGADIFKVGENLRKFHPATWNKIKDDWDEIYPKVKVKVDYKMNIRRVGIKQ
ncbi:Ger(x)C family spore germination protein [Paramaledivibacter caminithermalis]|jgi:Ger(x)C family germination protein|uniref:Germination protein, Ger(X)C family n=1 Tax=Paramaledivibacter caminithermalis (strain DSM 15212 / CIP 107654 / DViRD3) TaxID=1121301 RepID=A0A1M6KH19_PARC5|nr:Ger(x)C family spore germination protein [Paramaledivibacter caminithermalis]SHJ58172.1 germination protein, Ger(x)C family [Paramaledivibacter caminithermalis DSM 15212]